ncbi:Hpt domain-containing protein [Vibrio cyclitrophicus]|nr:Hpt domain-containing protein [Vibrio cyclitrophicus]UPR34881.1 Hpt domain-containing protein [Vibrio cyclitrophicus]
MIDLQEIKMSTSIRWLLSYSKNDQHELARCYIEVMQEDLLNLKICIDSSGNPIAILHKIKGGLSMIGATEMHQQAKEVLFSLRHSQAGPNVDLAAFIIKLKLSTLELQKWRDKNSDITDISP